MARNAAKQEGRLFRRPLRHLRKSDSNSNRVRRTYASLTKGAFFSIFFDVSLVFLTGFGVFMFYLL
jgi:hypothetical protein